MKAAKTAFTEVVELQGEGRTAHMARLRMGLLCRAALDKTFVEGAQATEKYQQQAASALLHSTKPPEMPNAREFQRIRIGESDRYVYLPQTVADRAFALGARYQRAEVTAAQAIAAMQELADDFNSREFRLTESLVVLQFLRDEATSSGSDVKDEDLNAGDENSARPQSS